MFCQHSGIHFRVHDLIGPSGLYMYNLSEKWEFPANHCLHVMKFSYDNSFILQAWQANCFIITGSARKYLYHCDSDIRIHIDIYNYNFLYCYQHVFFNIHFTWVNISEKLYICNEILVRHDMGKIGISYSSFVLKNVTYHNKGIMIIKELWWYINREYRTMGRWKAFIDVDHWRSIKWLDIVCEEDRSYNPVIIAVNPLFWIFTQGFIIKIYSGIPNMVLPIRVGKQIGYYNFLILVHVHFIKVSVIGQMQP